MPELYRPFADCLARASAFQAGPDPCLSPMQVIEGAAYIIAALVIFALVLAALTLLLGGRLVRAAPIGEEPSGAYALSAWAVAVIERLPRPWRDEVFYQDLQVDRPSVAKAALTAVVVGLVIVAPGAVAEAAAGRAIEGGQRLATGAALALVFWITLSAAAAGTARWLFGRRGQLGMLTVSLGFSLSPLSLFVFAPLGIFGLFVGFIAFFWSFALSYLAVRETVRDETVAMGIALATPVAAAVLWVFIAFIAGFGLSGCRSSNIKGARDSDGAKIYYLPGTPAMKRRKRRCAWGPWSRPRNGEHHRNAALRNLSLPDKRPRVYLA